MARIKILLCALAGTIVLGAAIAEWALLSSPARSMGASPSSPAAVPAPVALHTPSPQSASSPKASETRAPVSASSATAPGIEAIEKSIRQAEKSGATVGVLVYDMTARRDLYSYHATTRLPAASVIKLGVLGTVYDLKNQGQLTLTPALKADMRAMIGVSDNAAANRLVARCGMKAINAYLTTRVQAKDTHIVRQFGLPYLPGKVNTTTPTEACWMLYAVLYDEAFQPYQDDIRAFLEAAREHNPGRLVRYIPANMICYRKTGTLAFVTNDVAYCANPRTGHEIMACFLSEHGSQPQNQKASEEISRFVANQLATTPHAPVK